MSSGSADSDSEGVLEISESVFVEKMGNSKEQEAQEDGDRADSPAESHETTAPEADEADKKKQQQADKKLREKMEREEKKLKLKLQREEEKKKKEEERLKERQRKEAERLKEKALKEEERLREKAQREEERLKEKQRREEEKQREKQKKEEERLKKEQEKKLAEEAKIRKASKLQISNFFKPKASSSPSNGTSSSSGIKDDKTSESKDTKLNDYDTVFNQFYIKNNTKLNNQKRRTGDDLQNSIKQFDQVIIHNSNDSANDSKTWFKSSFRTDTENELSAKEIYEKNLENFAIKMKSIQFYENLKTFNGSFSQKKEVDLAQLARNPYLPTPVIINWEEAPDENEEGEGEDLNDDDDEEEEEDEDDDMDDFLDDDDVNNKSMKSVNRNGAPLVPKLTWKEAPSDSDNCFRIEILRSTVAFPIDPNFNYWETQNSSNSADSSPSKSSPAKQPDSKNTTTEDSAQSPNSKKPKSIITNKLDLEKFVAQVDNCDFTIRTLVEILQKQLPNYTKQTIENTIRYLAKKVGPKATEKKWNIDSILLEKQLQSAE